MSYDLMVFDPTSAPKERKEFMAWFEKQTEWSEDHGYQDHSVTTENLQTWFNAMIKEFPPMNGPLASDDFDDPKVTDYCIGKQLIYMAFSWSIAEDAFVKVRSLAEDCSVGFFDVSSDNGEVKFPDLIF